MSQGSVRQAILNCGRHVRGRLRACWLSRRTRAGRQLRVILGAGSTRLPGWIATDVDTLDITVSADWERLFRPASICRLLSEHVLEHLSWDQCRRAVANAYRFLEPGGLFRVAVPDGYRDDQTYRTAILPPADGHQLAWTVDTLGQLLREAGFRPDPVEYFDAQGTFHAKPWDVDDGLVRRSSRFDTREEFRRGTVCYTSLIIDAWKD